MFSFFTKKEFLVDHLDGFVDIHNHILPGIDDGAKTVEDSIALIKGFGEFGVEDFICTPHIMENYYPNTPETINSSLAILQNGLKMNNIENVCITAAAEHMIDAGFENLINSNSVMPLAKRYLLIEMSYLQEAINFNAALDNVMEKHLYPILAHPERYVFLHDNFSKYQKIKNKGTLFQLNMLSLGDYYGLHVQRTAYRLLKTKLIDFVASDLHNHGQLNALKNLKVSKKYFELLLPIIEKTKFNFKG